MPQTTKRQKNITKAKSFTISAKHIAEYKLDLELPDFHK